MSTISRVLFFGLFSIHTLAFAFDCQNKEPLFAAVYRGEQNVVARYLANQCAIDVSDEYGLTLYDLAAMGGASELQQWLVKQKVAKEGEYSSALIRLIQTGLRFLDFDAGVIDGVYNQDTQSGIKAFQKSQKQKTTGKITADWLRIFNRRLTAKVQQRLNHFGYAAGGADGIIGKKTQEALIALRKQYQLPWLTYSFIDDRLIYQIMLTENENNKKQIEKNQLIAKKQREQQKKAAAERLRQQEIARKQFEEREQQKALERERLVAAQLQKHVAQMNFVESKNTIHHEDVKNTLRDMLDAPASQKIPLRQTSRNLLAEQKAQAALQQAQLVAAKAAAAERTERAQAAQLIAEKQKAQQEEQKRRQQALLQAQQKQMELERMQQEQMRLAQLQAVRTAQAEKEAAEQAQKTESSTYVPAKKYSFNKLSGILKFGDSPRVCQINGQALDGSWCETHYPSGADKPCDAILSNTGIMVSLVCH